MKKILLAHGGGGEDTRKLVRNVFGKCLTNKYLDPMEDAALLPSGGNGIAFTTDSFTVFPHFFKGGDIGKLAVAGTVNDLSVSGAKPLYLSAGFIIEEGFPFDELERIVISMKEESAGSDVLIVTGDTKVMPKGHLQGIVINTAGIGEIVCQGLSASRLETGDCLIVTGSVGDHGACILAAREGLDFDLETGSDCASLWPLLRGLFSSGTDIHAMRDPTRGGLSAVLTEWSVQSLVEIDIREEAIPVKNPVRGICELLGMDPSHLACEGRAVIAVNEKDAEKVLAILKTHPLGEGSALLGSVRSAGTARVVLTSPYNTKRIMEPPSGELLPRIC